METTLITYPPMEPNLNSAKIKNRGAVRPVPLSITIRMTTYGQAARSPAALQITSAAVLGFILPMFSIMW